MFVKSMRLCVIALSLIAITNPVSAVADLTGGMVALSSNNPNTPPPAPVPTTNAITVPVKLTGAVGELIPITAETAAKLVTWNATPGVTFTQPYPADPSCKSMLVHVNRTAVQREGSRFTIFASIPDGDNVRSGVCVLQIGDAPQPGPDPGPGPGPGPDPGPVPPPTDKYDSIFAVVIEETNDDVSNRGNFMRDKTLSELVKAGKLNWRVADKDVVGPPKDGQKGVVPPDLVPYLNKAKGKKLPQLYLVGVPGGKVLYEGDFTQSPAELATLVKKHLK